MTNKTTTKRKPGRPKGSGNAEAVRVANTRCGKCQSPKKKAIRIVKERPISEGRMGSALKRSNSRALFFRFPVNLIVDRLLDRGQLSA